MFDAATTLQIERLRMAAALAHAIPQVAVELRPAKGMPLLISHDRTLHPDLNPCEFRSLIGRVAAQHDSILETGWLRDMCSVVVGGTHVRHDGAAALVVNPADQRRITVFTTELDTDAVIASARALARELVAEDPVAAGALCDVRLRCEHDPLLRASVVILPWSAEESIDDALQLTNAIAARCLVDEFLATAPIG